MTKLSIVLITVTTFLISTHIAFAQSTVKLKSGKTLEGRIIERADAYIILNLNGQDIVYTTDEIESINDTPSESKNDSKLITISGTIKPGVYQKGQIIITIIFDSPDKQIRSKIIKKVLPGPGYYSIDLKAPSSVTQVYIGCYNDADNKGSYSVTNPEDWYGGEKTKKPVPLDKPAIENINMILKEPTPQIPVKNK